MQIAINALLELREEATSGSLEMCTIDATLGNLGVGKKYIHTSPGLIFQFPTENVIDNKKLEGKEWMGILEAYYVTWFWKNAIWICWGSAIIAHWGQPHGF